MAEKKRILLVEDNKALNRINQRALELDGYSVITAETLADAKVFIERDAPNAIILDVLLPDGNGIEFCKKIREITSAPILFLTSVEGHHQALAGLRAGGDDYLMKPYNLEMLLARIATFFRREEIAEKLNHPIRTMTEGNMTLDIFSGKAIVNYKDMMLTPKEFSLLLFFMKNKDTIFTAEQLYKEIWKQPMTGDAHAIKNVIYRLRKKLDEVNSGFEIVTTRNKGYVFKRIHF